MKKEVLGIMLAGTMVVTVAGCASDSPEVKHSKAVAKASLQASTRAQEAMSVYHDQYLPYLGKLGIECINSLNSASLQDDADYNAGRDEFSKGTAAALIAGDCPTNLTSVDRANLYSSYHADVGDPLRDLIEEGALSDGTLSTQEFNTYRAKLEDAYLDGNISSYGEYILNQP
jgi:hypothetical protein